MKYQVIDKCILLAASIITAGIFLKIDYLPAFLCAVIALTSINFVAKKQWMKITLLIVFTAIAMIFPEMICFIPLAFYDGMSIDKKLVNIILALPMIVHAATVYSGRMLLVSLDGTGTSQIIERAPYAYPAIIVLTAFAGLMAYKTNIINKGYKEFLRLKDTSTEVQLLMEEKNRQLILNQDYELERAALDERNRISKELHDSIGHLLSRSMIQVGALSMISNDEPVKEGLNQLKDSLSEGMDSVRETIHNMRDTSFNLKVKVEELINNFDFCKVALDYFLESDPGIDVKYSFVAIIKEGLNNVIKHSDATDVYITVGELPTMYQLVISDNGSISESRKAKIENLVSAAQNSEGSDEMGLSGMIERTNKMNGKIFISTQKGMKINITVPKVA